MATGLCAIAGPLSESSRDSDSNCWTIFAACRVARGSRAADARSHAAARRIGAQAAPAGSRVDVEHRASTGNHAARAGRRSNDAATTLARSAADRRHTFDDEPVRIFVGEAVEQHVIHAPA
jgi:hypothetical protein